MLILITYTFTPLLGAEATGINNNGDIVGYELDNVLNGSAVSPYAQGYLYSHGQYTLLRPNPPESTDLIPRDVNDSGEIVGIVGSFCFYWKLRRYFVFVYKIQRFGPYMGGRR